MPSNLNIARVKHFFICLLNTVLLFYLLTIAVKYLGVFSSFWVSNLFIIIYCEMAESLMFEFSSPLIRICFVKKVGLSFKKCDSIYLLKTLVYQNTLFGVIHPSKRVIRPSNTLFLKTPSTLQTPLSMLANTLFEGFSYSSLILQFNQKILIENIHLDFLGHIKTFSKIIWVPFRFYILGQISNIFFFLVERVGLNFLKTFLTLPVFLITNVNKTLQKKCFLCLIKDVIYIHCTLLFSVSLSLILYIFI